MEYGNTNVITPAINDEKVIYLNAREEKLNQREIRLNSRESALENTKNALLEAFSGIFPDLVLVDKSQLESLLSDVEEAKESALNAQSSAEDLVRDAEELSASADDAYHRADDVCDTLRNIIRGIA